MKTIIYTRQAAHEGNFEAQLGLCRECCRTNNLNVITEISDYGSGNILNRPGLSALRSLVAEVKIDAVVVVSADRLSRNLAHLLVLRAELESAGVSLNVVN